MPTRLLTSCICIHTPVSQLRCSGFIQTDCPWTVSVRLVRESSYGLVPLELEHNDACTSHLDMRTNHHPDDRNNARKDIDAATATGLPKNRDWNIQAEETGDTRYRASGADGSSKAAPQPASARGSPCPKTWCMTLSDSPLRGRKYPARMQCLQWKRDAQATRWLAAGAPSRRPAIGATAAKRSQSSAHFSTFKPRGS